MAKVTGKGPIYIGAAPVLEMGSWSLNIANEVVTFNDLQTNATTADYGTQSYTGNCSGLTALNDTTGQDLLVAACVGKTKIDDIKIYENYTTTAGEYNIYWAPVTGSPGIVVQSQSITKDGGSETTKVEFAFTNDGLMERKVVVVPAG